MKLRPYQARLNEGVRAVWAAGGVPLAVLPTGGGKTPCFARLLKEHAGPSVAIAHRKELVGQMSRALAREGVHHRIIGPDSTRRAIVRSHHETFGRSFVRANSVTAVAGVDSLRNVKADRWVRSVGLWVLDEAHHLLRSNKWGKAIAQFVNAKGLGVTATPSRASGEGLGAHADGVFTHLVEGPTMRELIGAGYLCDYHIFCPESDLDLSGVKVGASGEFGRAALSAAVRKAKITGDVVRDYRRFADGLLGVTFVADVAAANEVAAAYCAAGIPALAVSAKTPPAQREDALKRFARREVVQLVNVDLFGEGFDVPTMQVCSFVRPTQSWNVFCQQFGRPLRLMPLLAKTHGIIIDHVGNVERHGLPDKPRVLSLDRRPKRARGVERMILTTTCPECRYTFERFLTTCPECGLEPVPAQRSGPEHVAGDLVQLDAETLARMRGEVAEVDRTPLEYARWLRGKHLDPRFADGHIKRHIQRQADQADLRATMEWWAGVQVAGGLTERESLKLFYLTFGVDALSARALKSSDAGALRGRVFDSLPSPVQKQIA